jgi:predicted enzyme related to lactoylglutathione lyase
MKLEFVLLFVADPLESAAFYGRLFAKRPAELAPTFARFELANGMQLGLWSNKTAEPAVTAKAGGSEICFNEDNVDAVYDAWKKMGIKMAQVPTDMDFGRTFVALDPDGHRIRVYRLHKE